MSNNYKSEQNNRITKQPHSGKNKNLFALSSNRNHFIPNSAHNDKQPDLKQLLTIAISIAPILGIIFGGTTVFFYLKSIDRTSLFPDILSNASTFIVVSIVVSIVFGILFLMLLINFVIPYAVVDACKQIKYKNSKDENDDSTEQNKDSNDKESKETDNQKRTNSINIPLWILTLTFPFNIIAIICTSFAITLIFFVICWIIFYYKAKTNIVNNRRIIGILFYSFILFFIFTIPIFYFETWLQKDFQWLFLLGYSLLFIFYICKVTGVFDTKNSPTNNFVNFLMVPILTIAIIVVGFSLSDNVPFRLLSPVKFVENHEDSSWYLLHNNFQNQETNGINHADLKKIKQRFTCSPKVSGKEKCPSSAEAHTRENALFGYMAWNVGNTKLFCPEYVRNDEISSKENKENKENKNKVDDFTNLCLVIDSQFLQPISKEYISQSTYKNDGNGNNTSIHMSHETSVIIRNVLPASYTDKRKTMQ